MLELIDIHTYYGETYALQGVSLEVRKKGIVALLGRNGMGKTTTLRSIIGVTPPRRGSIRFNGRDISGMPSYRIAQMGIGLVPQGRRIFPSLTVEENLTMSARHGNRLQAWTIDRIYSLFPFMEKRVKDHGNLLSGGEQQMLAIARALMTNPDLLLMDEPSEGLAPVMVQEVSNIITLIKEKGLSILIVEQNLPMVFKVADYNYILSRGQVLYQSTTEKLELDEEVKNRYLGVAK